MTSLNYNLERSVHISAPGLSVLTERARRYRETWLDTPIIYNTGFCTATQMTGVPNLSAADTNTYY